MALRDEPAVCDVVVSCSLTLKLLAQTKPVKLCAVARAGGETLLYRILRFCESWISLQLCVFVSGSTDCICFATVGTNDPVTSALHIIVGESRDLTTPPAALIIIHAGSN